MFTCMNIVKAQIPVGLNNPYKMCIESMFTLADIMVYYNRYKKGLYTDEYHLFTPLGNHGKSKTAQGISS